LLVTLVHVIRNVDVSFVRHFLAIFLLLTGSPSSFGWGPEGHRVVADIARSHLNTEARIQVRKLVGNDDLAAIANWADEIKSERPETAGWHFVDIPRDAAGFVESRDCFHADARRRTSEEDHHNCVVDRIEMFQRVLANKSNSREQRIEALKFLVHFVGDVHQPLHAIAEARGGNDVHVVEFGSSECGSRPCNLHFVWDMGLIEHSRRSELGYDQELERLIIRDKLPDRATGSPETWADESFRLAKQVWVNEGGTVDEPYYRKDIAVIDERLALAGLRLARILNQVLGR
jgi:S1/P1 Nuclease